MGQNGIFCPKDLSNQSFSSSLTFTSSPPLSLSHLPLPLICLSLPIVSAAMENDKFGDDKLQPCNLINGLGFYFCWARRPLEQKTKEIIKGLCSHIAGNSSIYHLIAIYSCFWPCMSFNYYWHDVKRPWVIRSYIWS